jgi:hypothetical protein
MSDDVYLPELPAAWEGTRATLHAYALAVAAIPRAYAEAHPKWWHVSLKLTDGGFVTDPIPISEGESLELKMDLVSHEVAVSTSGGGVHTVSMRHGLTGSEFAERLIQIAAAYGLKGDYDRAKFESGEAREYDIEASGVFRDVMARIGASFERHRDTLTGEVSPVQVWPHGFDLAFEWFGSRVETFEEHGTISEHPSQLNLGFYPAGRPYFYSNPWPFETDRLVDNDLPHGAEWHTDRWQGSILYYDQLQGDPDAEQKLLEYAATVFEIVAPTLTV